MAVPEPRFNANLPVTVVGTDRYGNRFKQTAMVENISRRGGRLTDIRCLRAPGDLVEVHCRGRKAGFRVVWIDVPSGRAGLCCLDESYIWGPKLPEPAGAELRREPQLPARVDWAAGHASARTPETRPAVSTPTIAAAAKPRTERRFPRYKCTGGAAATSPVLPTKLWGRLTTISMGGCYIETGQPLRPQTQVELLIGAYGIEARVMGEVRYSQPGTGMGVMFTDMTGGNRERLQMVIDSASKRSYWAGAQ